MSKISTLRSRNVASNKEYLASLLEELEILLKRLDPGSDPGYLSADNAAKYMDMPLGTLRQLVSKNMIRVYKPNNGKVYFKISDLDEFMQDGLVPSNRDLMEKAIS